MKRLSRKVFSAISVWSTGANAVLLALAFVLVLAVALRLWGISFGLPYVYHPDEPTAVRVGLRMLRTGDYNPHFFHYPTAYYYVVTVGLIIHFLLGASQGIFSSVTDVSFPRIFVLGSGIADFPAEFLVARLITLACGVGTVVLVFWIARRHWGDRAGVLAALILALSAAFTFNSRFATPDVPVTFAVTLTTLLFLEFIRADQFRFYAWGCLVGGLAISTKYNAGYIVGVLIVSSYVTVAVREREWRQPMLMAAAALCPLGFLGATPFAFLSLPEFLDDVAFELRHYATGHAGMEGNSLIWYLEFLLKQEGILALLAVLGGVYSIVRRRVIGLMVFATAVVYFAFVSRFAVRNGRTILPILPFLALSAGLALDAILDSWRKWLGPRNRLAGLVTSAALVGLVVLWPARNIVETSQRLASKDVRTIALEWISENLPSSARFAVEAYGPPLDPDEFGVVYTDLISQDPQWFEQEGFDFVVMSTGAYGRFFADPGRYPEQIARYEVLNERFDLVKMFQGPMMGYAGGEIRLLSVAQP